MQRVVRLPLYGEIEHGPADDLAWNIYQSAELARLRDISLSSVPSRFAPHGVATSRFQHSVAVGYLARLLCARQPELADERDLLVSAALLHDSMSTPFSHISEVFLYDRTGRTHEQQTRVLLSGDGELVDLLARHRVDPLRVSDIVTGRDRLLGSLIAGSIDLDNVSNTVDLLASLGYHDELPYHPVRLVDAFVFADGELRLDTAFLSELLGWAKARRMLYGLLHSEPNLSAATMLYRAIEFAYAAGAIGEDFFAMGESEALLFLRRHAGRQASDLIEAEERWRHFPRLHERQLDVEDPRLVGLYGDWRARKAFTDELARRLGIPAEEMTFYVGRDRASKPIDVPFIGDGAEAAAALFSEVRVRQRLAVFAHKSHQALRDSQRVADTVDALIDEKLTAPSGPVHAFF